MNVGDRVITPRGPGTITRFMHDNMNRWSFGRPQPVTFVIVHVDHMPFQQIFMHDQLKEAPVFACTDIDIDESAGQSGLLIQQLEEPEPTPDPEPEPDTEEEGGEEELTPWP